MNIESMSIDRQIFSLELINLIIPELEDNILLSNDSVEIKYLGKVLRNLKTSAETWQNYILTRSKKV